mmetsp:Transcript_5459/g.15798  ORF Transcript_5459/g.15798 Transcript_5459/m.15798 type:complete len:277 (-) Transcript_5459:690-1520(-)
MPGGARALRVRRGARTAGAAAARAGAGLRRAWGPGLVPDAEFLAAPRPRGPAARAAGAALAGPLAALTEGARRHGLGAAARRGPRARARAPAAGSQPLRAPRGRAWRGHRRGRGPGEPGQRRGARGGADCRGALAAAAGAAGHERGREVVDPVVDRHRGIRQRAASWQLTAGVRLLPGPGATVDAAPPAHCGAPPPACRVVALQGGLGAQHRGAGAPCGNGHLVHRAHRALGAVPPAHDPPARRLGRRERPAGGGGGDSARLLPWRADAGALPNCG